ncbi:hypothetical protein ABPG75_010790 [Micractinium tetrahymenae]
MIENKVNNNLAKFKKERYTVDENGKMVPLSAAQCTTMVVKDVKEEKGATWKLVPKSRQQASSEGETEAAEAGLAPVLEMVAAEAAQGAPTAAGRGVPSAPAQAITFGVGEVKQSSVLCGDFADITVEVVATDLSKLQAAIDFGITEYKFVDKYRAPLTWCAKGLLAAPASGGTIDEYLAAIGHLQADRAGNEDVGGEGGNNAGETGAARRTRQKAKARNAAAT